MAGVPKVRRVIGVRPVCRVVHHAVYRREHAVHGAGPPRYGQGHGKGAEEWQLRRYLYTQQLSSTIVFANAYDVLFFSFLQRHLVLKRC